MRELHAVLLRLADAADAARARRVVWAVLRFELPGLPGDAARDEGVWEGGEGASARWTTLHDDDGVAFLHDFTWARPERRDPSLRHRVAVTVGGDGLEAWVLVRSSLEPVGATLLDVDEVSPRPARLVGTLVERVPCVDAGRQLSIAAEWYPRDRVPELGALITATPSRALPVLVLSAQPGGAVAVDPDGVAARLVGVAHVVVVADDARSLLTDEVGAALAIPPGGARLFWPRLRSDDPPARHEAYAPEELGAGGDRPRFPEEVARHLFRVAVTRVGEPRSLRARLLAARARAQRRDIEGRDRQPRATGPDAGAERERAELLEQWESSLRELEEAREESAELERRLASALEDRERLLAGLARVEGDVAEPPPPATLLDAVQRADARAVATVFLPEAFDSARRSQSRDPRRVYGALRALDRVAQRWRQRQLTGSSVGAALREEGLDWAGDVSDTAKTKHGGQYRRRYRDGEVQLGPHLRLEGALRAYCHLDRERRTVVVGHVGAHLAGKRDA